MITKFKSLAKSYGISKTVFKFSDHLPNEEKYGIVSQVKHSVVSIVLNITEGAERHTDK